jgi:hypothetical protein
MRYSLSNFDKAVNKAVKNAVADVRKEMQSLLDSFARRYQGRPVSEIKPALMREWRQKKIPGDVTDAHFTEWSQAISDGTRIKVN